MAALPTQTEIEAVAKGSPHPGKAVRIQPSVPDRTMRLMSIFLVAASIAADGPLTPVWSPDHTILAEEQVGERFVTPAGADFCLLLGNRPVYPAKCKKRHHHPAYSDIHTFLTGLVWSPDSKRLAFLERVYDWEYNDPYNRDFTGAITQQRILLVIISAQGEAAGYKLLSLPKELQLHWRDTDHIDLSGHTYDLRADQPRTIQ